MDEKGQKNTQLSTTHYI